MGPADSQPLGTWGHTPNSKKKGGADANGTNPPPKQSADTDGSNQLATASSRSATAPFAVRFPSR
jgi:hypothetical protein